MLMRSRFARVVILTRYAMRGFEFRKEFLHVLILSSLSLFQALANAFASVGEGGDVEESMIRLGVLHNSGGLAFDREHDRPFALLKLFQKVPGPAAEGSQRLDILCDVEHSSHIVIRAPFQVLSENALSGPMSLGEALQVPLDHRRLARRDVAQLALPHPFFQLVDQAEKV